MISMPHFSDLSQHTTYDFKAFLKSLPLNFSAIRHTFLHIAVSKLFDCNCCAFFNRQLSMPEI